MKKITLLGFALFFTLYAYAQDNFLTGYVVTLQNDTLQGLIDFKDWKTNPTQISFRNATGTVSYYEPLSISSFSVANEIYESASVDVEVSSDKLYELTAQAEFKIEKQVAFLQSVVRGKKSLLALQNKIGKQNFYIKKGSNYELLLYKRYTLPSDARKTYKNNRYQGQLAVYLDDCKSIQGKLGTKRYTKKDISDLFAAYYECTGEKTDFVKSKDKTKLEWTILIGASSTTVNVKSNANFALIDKMNFGASLKPTGGISLNIVLPRNRGRFSINNELLYYSYSFTDKAQQYTNANEYRISTITLESSQIKLNTLARIKIPIQLINFRIEAGVSNAFAFSTTADWVNFQKFGQSEITTNRELMENLKKYEVGIMGGVGVDFKRLSFTTRFELGQGIANEAEFSTPMRRLNFMLGYRLNK